MSGIRAHRDAVLAFYEQHLPGSVFKSYSAATDQQRYAVVFVALTSSEQTRFTGEQSRDTYTVTVHSVGADEDAALWVAERVMRLKGVRLTVPERSLKRARFVTSQPPDLSDDGVTPLWFTISQFDLISDPA